MRWLLTFEFFVLLLVIPWSTTTVVAQETHESRMLHLQLRSQIAKSQADATPDQTTVDKDWPADKTAIVICDMWDDHYCRASARRVAEMAPTMNRVLDAARDRGVLIIHCPSGCMDKYEGMQQRIRAQSAPQIATLIPLQNWCFLDPKKEPPLPIEDSEPCDDEMPREKIRFYNRQIETLRIAEQDAITDSAEAYFLMKQKKIQHVIIMGVHTNMCVLGRPFGIRQLVAQGMDVALMRDMTDCMYSPKQKPFVDHFTGLDLVIQHIERHWCPTITSDQIIGGKPFHFAEDKRNSSTK